jgi:NAD+ diphosphatase
LPESWHIRPFVRSLPLSRAALDRDHASRPLGIEVFISDPRARAIVISEGTALLAAPDRLALIPVDAIETPAMAIYLGRVLVASDDLEEGAPVVALVVEPEAAAMLAIAGMAEWGDLRRIGARLDERDAGLFTAALGIVNWHNAYGFSPRAGVQTTPTHSGWVRVDPDTGTEFFPRTDPAVIVGITDDDDRLLLGSNALWESNRFSLLAGFVEPGESLEATVVREVFEESGLRVVDPVYLGSQPWPFPASLMLGFSARLAPGTSPEVRPDGTEILELRWFSREQLAAAVGEIQLPGPTSIARAIIEHWYGDEIEDGSRG